MRGGVLTNFIWAIQMPGFFIVSGYFAYRRSTSVKELINSAWKSSYRYFIPFLSWLFIVSTLILGKHNRNIITALTFIIRNVDSGLWFLWVIYILSLFAGIANYYINKEKVFTRFAGTTVTWLLLYAICAFLAIKEGYSFCGVKYILYYSIFYLIGYFIHAFEEIWITRIKESGYQIVAFICMFIYIGIIFNFDLYRCNDNLIGIVMRFTAGIAGNYILFFVIKKYQRYFEKAKLALIGQFTLEIYVVSAYVSHLMTADSIYSFFSVMGFLNFLFSLSLTIIFTTIIIAAFKAFAPLDFIFFGKMPNKMKPYTIIKEPDTEIKE